MTETNCDLMAFIGAAPEFDGPGLLLPTRNRLSGFEGDTGDYQRVRVPPWWAFVISKP
jgi:hypothetical protein